MLRPNLSRPITSDHNSYIDNESYHLTFKNSIKLNFWATDFIIHADVKLHLTNRHYET